MIVRIGPWPVALEVHPAARGEAWLPWLRRCPGEGPAAVSILVEEDPAGDPGAFLEDLLRLQGLAEGPGRAIRREESRLTARIPSALLDAATVPGFPRLLNILLCAAFNEARARGGGNEVLFHGAAVVAGGRAVLLAGPSGAGKSTLAGLAGPERVLHDEAVVLSTGPAGEILAETTPLLGSLVPAGPRGPLPVERIALLVHGEREERRAVPPTEGVPRLLPQIFRSSGPFPGANEIRGDAETRLDWAVLLAGRLPLEEFRFRPTPGAIHALIGEAGP